MTFWGQTAPGIGPIHPHQTTQRSLDAFFVWRVPSTELALSSLCRSCIWTLSISTLRVAAMRSTCTPVKVRSPVTPTACGVFVCRNLETTCKLEAENRKTSFQVHTHIRGRTAKVRFVPSSFQNKSVSTSHHDLHTWNEHLNCGPKSPFIPQLAIDFVQQLSSVQRRYCKFNS